MFIFIILAYITPILSYLAIAKITPQKSVIETFKSEISLPPFWMIFVPIVNIICLIITFSILSK